MRSILLLACIFTGPWATLAFAGATSAGTHDRPPAATTDTTRPAMHNMINWFEIPATDFGRATAFYATVLGVPIEPMEMDGTRLGMLPGDGRNVSGAIVYGEGYVPGQQGALIYLSGGEDLSPALARVAAAGGQVLVPKTQITPEYGYFALFIDTEGNKVGLHSPE